MSRAENSVLWTDADAAAATAGEAAGGWRATGVSIDTRTLAPGDLFVAISGPNFDGHDFAAEALTKGAAAVLVAAANPATAKLDPAAPRLVAADTLAALEDLGRAARARTGARIAAVTGSVGKTGTKEALGLALGAQGRIAATAGNLNNHWGLPLSLARMPAATDFGIFELGMSAPGEIAPLTAMTRPHVAVITAIAHVHSEFFPSLDGIADAKAEIFLGLEPGGTAILNRDSDYFDHLAGKAREAGAANIVGFGAATAADYRLLDCTLGDDGSEVLADLAGREVAYRLGVAGRHWVENSLAVLAAVDALGADVAAAAASLAGMRGMKGRGERRTVAVAGGQFTLIDESYNASPASMAAAIRVLGNGAPGSGARRIAVLGDMLELGQRADQLHAELADHLSAAGVDLVFTAGRHMAALFDALPAGMRGGHANAADKLVPLVTAAARAGDLVMVKGSLGSRTGQIVEALLDMAEAGSGERKHVVNGE